MMGYGVYLPALIVSRRLARAGIDSEVYLVENLFTDEKKKTFRATRQAFGKNFRLAQLAAKVPTDYHACIDRNEADRIYDLWNEQMATDFLCFSGLWLDMLEDYIPGSGIKNITCCRIDAGEATTWANRNNIKIDRTYYFSNLQTKEINYTLAVPAIQALSYPERQHAVLVHGGGWGLGNFVEKTEGLEQAGYARKIILNDGLQEDRKNTSFFVGDPNWDPLLHPDAEKLFPPLGAIENGSIKYTYCPEHHTALKLIHESKAVISKPGGMTLVDAIITETPFIYLDPMGPNEQGNTILIEHHQLGTSYEVWKNNNFSEQLLQDYHNNIRKLKEKLPDFVTCYIQDWEKKY
jgi:hypothetical protein